MSIHLDIHGFTVLPEPLHHDVVTQHCGGILSEPTISGSQEITKWLHLAYKHVKHPQQRTAAYKYAFLLTFIKERRETWDTYKLCALLQRRVCHKIYCHRYKLASLYNWVTVLCITSPCWQDCCIVKCCCIYVWTELLKDLSHFIPSCINMLSLILISPGDCKLGGRASRGFSCRWLGPVFPLACIPLPLVRLLNETYSKITLVIIWALSGKKT